MSRGRKILTILLVLAAVFGGGAFWLVKTVGGMQAEMDAVVEPMIRDLADHRWDKAVMDKYASPELKQWLLDNKLDGGFVAFNVLGKVQAYGGIQQFSASSSRATVVSLVTFEKGDSTITFQLSKKNGAWLLDNLNIDSPVFLQQLNGSTHAA